MKKKRIRNLVIFSSVITLLFVTGYSLKRKKKDIKIEKNKIEYNSGTIYIGDDDYLDTIKTLGPNDVLVLDKRYDKDPNLKIYGSYKITNPEIREEIIDALLKLESMEDTPWERSKVSLLREWYAHNLLYDVSVETHRTADVDLNNNDEKTYRIRDKFFD
jgi:hypothetical protein